MAFLSYLELDPKVEINENTVRHVGIGVESTETFSGVEDRYLAGAHEASECWLLSGLMFASARQTMHIC